MSRVTKDIKSSSEKQGTIYLVTEYIVEDIVYSPNKYRETEGIKGRKLMLYRNEKIQR